MSGLIFPIVETTENRLIALSGNVGHFFKLLPPDQEQMTMGERSSYYEQISHGLDKLSDGAYYKFYSWGGVSYLETNSKELPEIPNVQVVAQADALKIFFESHELYSDIGIHDDYLSFQGNYWRILSVKGWGSSEIGPDFIPDGVDYVLSIKRCESDRAMKRLDRIRQGHLNSFSKGKRDIESEGAYAESEGLMEDLNYGRESLFLIELFFVVKGLSLENLKESTHELQSLMSTRGVKLYSEGQSLLHLKSGLGELFNELIPGVKPVLSLRTHTDKTTHLRNLLPLTRSFLMEEGIELAGQRGETIFFDPFLKSLKNKNMLVTGTSGGGKSVFVNKIVHALIDKHPTVILDKGASYKRMSLYHDGHVMEGGFNPLQFRDPLYLKEFILALVDPIAFPKLKQGHLLSAIKEALQDIRVQTFADLVSALESTFDGISYYFEECRDYFRGEDIPEVKILYVDVENFPKGIVAPLIIFLLEYFKRIPATDKILVFDECWSFLRLHSVYIDECFRTFRKTGALPIAISQGLRDFSEIGTELAGSITNNSYFKVFFPQELQLSDEITTDDQLKVASLLFSKGNFSDCYLKSSDNKYRKILRIFLNPLELELFNTEVGDFAPFMQFFNQNRAYFSSNKDTIDAYVRMKHGFITTTKTESPIQGQTNMPMDAGHPSARDTGTGQQSLSPRQ